jgi:hypothetical protein
MSRIRYNPFSLKDARAQLGPWVASPLTVTADTERVPAGWTVQSIALLPGRQAYAMLDGDPALRERLKVTAEQLDRLHRFTSCPGASTGCASLCYSGSGMLGLPIQTEAKLRRQLGFLFKTASYMEVLVASIASARAAAMKAGKKLAIRLNLTSDIAWEHLPISISDDLADWLGTHAKYRVLPGRYPNIPTLFPDLLFYDFTKVAGRMRAFLHGKLPGNMHLTWSFSENADSIPMAMDVLESGKASVVMVFDLKANRACRAGGSLPPSVTLTDSRGRVVTVPVVDGDAHDMGPFYPPHAVAGSRYKPARGISKTCGGDFLVKTDGSPVRLTQTETGYRANPRRRR